VILLIIIGSEEHRIKYVPGISMIRKVIASIFVLVLLSHTLPARPIITAAQSNDAGQLIAEVNGFRAAYGLPPLDVNNSLMAAAQQQSN
jgi:uncharacterized protein YkwD